MKISSFLSENLLTYQEWLCFKHLVIYPTRLVKLPHQTDHDWKYLASTCYTEVPVILNFTTTKFINIYIYIVRMMNEIHFLQCNICSNDTFIEI
jgi:hypothetical protein